MFKIVKKRELNPTVTEMVIEAPLIAKKAKAGQFIIIRAKEDSERIPLTIAHYDAAAGTVAIIFQIVGAGTMQLNSLKEGEYVHDFVGPLGKATEIEGLKNVCVVGGGVGCAIALPVAQALKAQGTKVTGIIGFRNKDLLILEDEFNAALPNVAGFNNKITVGQYLKVIGRVKRNGVRAERKIDARLFSIVKFEDGADFSDCHGRFPPIE